MVIDAFEIHLMAKEMKFADFEHKLKSLALNQPETAMIKGRVKLVITVSGIGKLSPTDFKHFIEAVGYFDEKLYREKEWLECYDKLIRLDKYTEEGILYVVKYFRKEGNWWYDTGNFNTLLKLRKLDKEKVKYMDLFVTKIKAERKERDAHKQKGFAPGNIINKSDGKQRDY